MIPQTAKPKTAVSEMISMGLHALTIAILGVFSLAAVLHVTLLIA